MKYKDFTEASPSLASDQRQPQDGPQARWRVSRLPHPQAAAASGCSAVPSGPSRGSCEVSHRAEPSELPVVGAWAPRPPTHPQRPFPAGEIRKMGIGGRWFGTARWRRNGEQREGKRAGRCCQAGPAQPCRRGGGLTQGLWLGAEGGGPLGLHPHPCAS